MLSGTGSCSAEQRAAKAPPSVAPMNSDGEKMPPDEPEPRLSEVASSLQTNSRTSSQTPMHLAGQDRLDRRVADALDVIVPEADAAARTSGMPTSSMPSMWRR